MLLRVRRISFFKIFSSPWGRNTSPRSYFFRMSLEDRIFQIKSIEDFRECALEVFRFQARNCAPYRKYISLLEVNPDEVTEIENIPMLPVEFFKTYDIYSAESAPQKIFTSSATTGMTPSRHLVKDISLYDRDYTECFRHFYGDETKWNIYGLLPSYLEREGSSLIHMVDGLIQRSGKGGFYLYNHEELLRRIKEDKGPKILLGVTYALLDLAENYAPDLSNVIVMETGGMKGHRKELPKNELHALLKKAFNVDAIHSEYGMAEMMSQAYSKGDGVFVSPPWVRILIRDVNDPSVHLGVNRRGGVDVIDLGNLYSCSFLSTQDKGIALSYNEFRLEGRLENSDIRGCNLLVQ